MFLYRIFDKFTQNVIIVMPWSVATYNVNLTHAIYQIGYRISANFDIRKYIGYLMLMHDYFSLQQEF